jgi:hypothetical protein
VSRKYLSKRNFKVPAGVGVVSIKGIERILRHYIRLSKSRSGFLRLENAQIAANFGLIFAVCISCIEVLKTRKNKGSRLLETLIKKQICTQN